MEHGATRKVAAEPEQRHTLHDFTGLALPLAECGIGTHDPFCVCGVQIHRAAEAARPILHARVIVRVRNRDRTKPAQFTNERLCRTVQQAYAVPQDITLGRPQPKRALANSDLWMSLDFA